MDLTVVMEAVGSISIAARGALSNSRDRLGRRSPKKEERESAQESGINRVLGCRCRIVLGDNLLIFIFHTRHLESVILEVSACSMVSRVQRMKIKGPDS